MIDFERRFKETKGRPFTADGVEYCAYVRVNTGAHGRFRVRFLDGIKRPRQGIRVDCAADLECGRRRTRSFAFWRDRMPAEFEVACQTGTDICVRNIWDEGDGVEHSWHAGGAMRAEVSGAGIRLRANSTLQGDDCADLVAELLWE